MKCILLAGGKGDRMWPLSRKNYPKQFIEIKNNHSIFQETIARNMAFCDEFIIVTNKEYQSVIENQMKAFKGLTYRCVFEEEGKNTAPAVVMAAMLLPLSELLFVVASDQIIEGKGYKNTIVEARKSARKGNMELLKGNMFMAKNGDFFKAIRELSEDFVNDCEKAYNAKTTTGNYIYYSKESMAHITRMSIEEAIRSNEEKLDKFDGEYDVKELGGLDDLQNVSLQDVLKKNAVNEPVIDNKCDNTTVINRAEDKLVMVNHLKDVLVVNTDDAVYIGKKGMSNDLKEIILKRKDMWDYFNKSNLFFRKWGSFQILSKDERLCYEVRKVTILPGKTIYSHKHNHRSEIWNIVRGRAKTIIGGVEKYYSSTECVTIPPNTEHQISCVSDEELIIIESSTGVEAKSEDIIDVISKDVPEGSLGYDIEPFVLLSPTYKDYLWGGNRLKKDYGKKCDYDVIAESWELSAHKDGQSVIEGGKYDGMLFSQYINTIGIDYLGWKYTEQREFPLMIKLIDAKKDLSIQVHPGDDYALEHENEYGKSELWYIIDCEKDSYIYCGFKEDVSREKIKEALDNNSITDYLNKIPVEKGKTYYIPSGTVHAIGEGCLICEIQQNSNSTYRLYDYNRVDKYGNKRKLDIEKALDVLDYKKYSGNQECKYFTIKVKKCVDRSAVNMTDESFSTLMILEGKGEIAYKHNSLKFTKGNCIFLPKNNGKMKLTGRFEYIEVRI